MVFRVKGKTSLKFRKCLLVSTFRALDKSLGLTGYEYHC